MKQGHLDHALLAARVSLLRGSREQPPHASIVIPVNAQGDLIPVLNTVNNLCAYNGRRRLEIVLAINNYAAHSPPPELASYSEMGLTIAALPAIKEFRPGVYYRVAFGARILGTEAANSNNTIHFDADCRLVNATTLLDWYVDMLATGYSLAYTPVGYYDVRNDLSIKVRLTVHHITRWLKRNLLRIPTSRGSNYAVNRQLLLRLFDEQLVREDLQLGRAVKAAGGKCVYAGQRDLRVLTSGRNFYPGWTKLFRYNRYRLRYNLSQLRQKSRGGDLLQQAIELRAASSGQPSQTQEE